MDGKRSWPLVLLLAILYAPRAMWGWIKRRSSGNPAGTNASRWDKGR
ncbi:hypothetical protein [Bordetella bronchiseptica]|nr:hypothetical protein [Bordetella bronchiseptica]KDB58347.1 hypothetical protein AZ15_1975 [Bordetella bronchiseptica A1-7]KDB69694.1 hypothetical protein AZ21_3789 [Bordetella bronchiseptica B20-10725633]KDB70745.1 hypothetical protein AZ21_1767 [Bordetella bronchiseptica B20-10725633]KDB73050.1 hypothetical protein AZ21_2213 [Bordetella bronchiseptica B20-10725633]